MVLPGLVLLPELDHGIGSSDEHVFLQKNSAVFPFISMQMAKHPSFGTQMSDVTLEVAKKHCLMT